MRRVRLGLLCGIGLAATAAAAAQPYDGVWATNVAACRSKEGVEGLVIGKGQFDWYETMCRTQSVKATGRAAWLLHVACSGEGRRFKAQPRLSMPTAGRLVMDESPVGPGKRQIYVRCRTK